MVSQFLDIEIINAKAAIVRHRFESVSQWGNACDHRCRGEKTHHQ
jgi:hypothetical protein